jgi:hypothetical protein
MPKILHKQQRSPAFDRKQQRSPAFDRKQQLVDVSPPYKEFMTVLNRFHVKVLNRFQNSRDNVLEKASCADLITDAVSLGRSQSDTDTAELHEGDEIECTDMTEEEQALDDKLFIVLQSAVDLVEIYRRVKPTKVGGARRAYALQRFREKRCRRNGKPYKDPRRQKLATSRPRLNGRFQQAMVSYVNPWFP